MSITIKASSVAIGFLLAGNAAYASTTTTIQEDAELRITRRAVCMNNGMTIKDNNDVLKCRNFFYDSSRKATNADNVAAVNAVCRYRHNSVPEFKDCRWEFAMAHNLDISNQNVADAIISGNKILAGTHFAIGKDINTSVAQAPVPKRFDFPAAYAATPSPPPAPVAVPVPVAVPSPAVITASGEVVAARTDTEIAKLRDEIDELKRKQAQPSEEKATAGEACTRGATVATGALALGTVAAVGLDCIFALCVNSPWIVKGAIVLAPKTMGAGCAAGVVDNAIPPLRGREPR